MTPNELKAWFQRVHPGWNWDNRCAGVCYQVCVATGRAVQTYATATDGYKASVIESRDMLAAPAGAFHFWSYWAAIGGARRDYGHVAVSFGGGWALMSNPEASEADWGIALGVTNVTTWTARRRGIVTYLGWSRTYGQNTAQITSQAPAGGGSTPFPDPAQPEEEDDDMRPTVHIRTEGTFEATRAHPLIGTDLDQHTGPGTGTKRVSGDGKVTTYRGFEVTADQTVAAAWARTHAKGVGGETSRTDRAGYSAIQVEASRLSVEIGAALPAIHG